MIKKTKATKKSLCNYYRYEAKYWNEGKLVLGLDEAGRGCWAGPLVVAGVILPPNYRNDSIRDSKLLSAKKRQELYQVIMENALGYQVSFIAPKTVDEKNPKQATIDEMEALINYFTPEPHVAFIDAEKIPNAKIPTLSIIKGDQKSTSIAAASILAKVSRDAYMEQMQKKYPDFSFAKHKGYGTLVHLKELKKHGPIPGFHRYSYRPVKQVLKEQEEKKKKV